MWFRIGAASVATVMLGAILLVHLPHGFDISNGGMEYALAQLLITVALPLFGPGKFSLIFLVPPAAQVLISIACRGVVFSSMGIARCRRVRGHRGNQLLGSALLSAG